jgi:hypothetical protein
LTSRLQCYEYFLTNLLCPSDPSVPPALAVSLEIGFWLLLGQASKPGFMTNDTLCTYCASSQGYLLYFHCTIAQLVSCTTKSLTCCLHFNHYHNTVLNFQQAIFTVIGICETSTQYEFSSYRCIIVRQYKGKTADALGFRYICSTGIRWNSR